jgi:hypothetical protein
MSLILSGTDGLSDVDGTAATPAIRGTDANTGIFFPAADTIAFSEGGVEAMRIDSAGRVTQPFQPCFWALGTGNISQPVAITKLNLDSVGTNIGSVFNTTTSRFTAPVAGSYEFTALITWDTAGSASYAGLLLFRNGSSYAQTYTQKPSGGYAQVTLPVTITLSANDYIEVSSEAATSGLTIEMGRTSLSGQLIG